MEKRVGKMLLILAIVVVVLASDVEGGRKLKGEEKETKKNPQNFLGGGPVGIGGLFPSPGFAGVGFGPSGFCSFPGGCTGTPTLPTNPGFGGVSPPHAIVSPPHA